MESSSIRETIPAEIKRHFFKNVSPPNLIEDYDVIGFDADHCMVKYKIKPLVEILVREELDDLT